MYLFHADKIHFWRFMEIYFCGKPIKLFLGDGMYRKIWKNCYSLVFWCSTQDHEFHSIHAHKSRGIRFWSWMSLITQKQQHGDIKLVLILLTQLWVGGSVVDFFPGAVLTNKHSLKRKETLKREAERNGSTDNKSSKRHD